MTLETRHFFGGMNQDNEDRLLADGEYRFGLNIRNGSSENSDTGSITNTLGNELISFDLPGGQNRVIGVKEDVRENRIFYFLFNSDNRHQVREYDITTNTIQLVLESGFLNFDKDFYIWHIDIIGGDLLKWTDNNEEPSQLEVSRAKNELTTYFPDAGAQASGTNLGFNLVNNTLAIGDKVTGSAFSNPLYNVEHTIISKSGNFITVNTGFTSAATVELGLLTFNPGGYPAPFTRQYLDVIKYPPTCPPTMVYDQDITRSVNSLEKKRWQSKYRYVYADNSRSSWSAISKISIREYDGVTFRGTSGSTQLLVEPPDYYANELLITLEAGDFYVKEIEVAVRESAAIFGNEASGDFFLITTINRTDISGSTTVTKFLNDKIFSSIDLTESNKSFDRVPLKAGAQAVLDGNRIAYASITEGTDVDPIDVSLRVISNPEGSTQVNFFSGFDGSEVVRIDTGNIVAHQLFHLEITLNKLLFSYFVRTEPGDTPESVMLDLIAQIENDPLADGVIDPIPVNLGGGVFKFIINPLIVGALSSIADTFVTPKLSHKKGANHEFGIEYLDKGGRITSVRTSDDTSIYVPWYGDLPDGERGLIDIEFTINHDPPEGATHYQIVHTQNQSVGRFLQTLGEVTDLGNDRYSILLDQVVFWNSLSPGSSVTYDFTEGDRFRAFLTNNVYLSNVKDVKVISFDSSTVSIVVEIKGIDASQIEFFEIYTPKKEVEAGFFFEIGECYKIENGKHLGNVQDQTETLPAKILLDDGDVYLIKRTLILANGPDVVDGPQMESLNISDQFVSGHANEGRVNVIDSSYRRITREATIYISDVFIDDTNINGLSTFYGFSFPDLPARAKDYDKSFGSIQKLYAEDKTLIMFQELKVGRALVNESVVFDQAGVPSLTKSNEVLSDIIYYDGEWGIGKFPGSFAVRGKIKSFADPNRGSVLELNGGQITEISEIGMHNFFTDIFKDSLSATPLLLGVNDVKFDQYVLSINLEQVLTGTWTFEKDQGGFRGGQSGINSIQFDSSVDLSAYGVGQFITLCYFDRLTSTDVCRGPFQIVSFTSGGQTINVIDPSGGLELQDELNDGDVVNIFNPQAADQSIIFDPIIPETDELYDELFSLSPINLNIAFTDVSSGQVVTQTLVVQQIITPEFFIPPVVLNIAGFSVFAGQVNTNGAFPNIADGDTVLLTDFARTNGSKTIAFNYKEQRWETFYSYIPEIMVGAATDIVTFRNGELYRHNENSIHNNFYGQQFSSEIHLVSNMEPDARKVYLSLVEKSNEIWEMFEGTNQLGQKTNLVKGDFEDIEGDKVAAFLKDENSIGGLIEGEDMRDNVMTAKLRNSKTTPVKLFSVGFNHVLSERTNK